MPVLYAATLLTAGLLHPGYSHVALAPSELGAAGAPSPQVFNTGMVAASLSAEAGATGLMLGLGQLGAGDLLSLLTGFLLALLGISMGMAGLLPLSSPLHYVFGLTMAGPLTPLLGALALRHVAGIAACRWLLILAFLA